MTSSTLFIGQNRIHLSETDSTNNYARELARDKLPIEGTLITTDRQNAGRGQRSNSWLSEPNLNLTGSYILKPAFLAAKDQFMLSAAVALAVYDSVQVLVKQADVKIKWPNDILVDGEKIAGILIENMLKGSLLDCSIVGIGLNVNQTNFPTTVSATSLQLKSKSEWEIDEVIQLLNQQLEKRYFDLRKRNDIELLRLFNERLFGLKEKRPIVLNGNEVTVQVIGARPKGELELEHEDGSRTLHQHHEIDWKLKA